MASAGQIKGITIKIEGDTSGLAKDLEGVNKEVKQTENALKDVEKALKLDPKNLELLQQEQALLNKQIEQTEQKLALEKQAAEDAKEALRLGNISQEEYATLTAEVANTENSLKELKGKAEENGNAIESMGLKAKLATAGFTALKEGVELTMKGIYEISKMYGELCIEVFKQLGDAAIAGGKALVDATLDTAAFADDLNAMSTVTGLTTDQLQELQYAADFVDVSVDTMTGSMTKNIKSMASAADAANALKEEQELAAEAFANGDIDLQEYQEVLDKTTSAYDKLGVNITNADGSLRDSTEVYWEVIDALGQVDNETERNALAMELLGKSAMDLNPMIEAGSETMAGLAQEAHEVGAVMDGEALDAFNDLNDSVDKMKKSADSAKKAVGMVLLPSLSSMSSQGADLLGQFSAALLDTGGDVEKIGEVINQIFPQVCQLIIDQFPQLVETAVQIIVTLCETLTNETNLQATVEAITTIIQTLCDAIITLLPVLIPAVMEIITTVVKTLLLPENLTKLIQTALQLVITIATSFAENVGELIPAVVQAIITIASELVKPENLLKLITAAWDVVKAIGTGIAEALGFTTFANAVADIFNKVYNKVKELLDGAWGWGYDMIQNFANGIIAAADLCEDGIAYWAGVIDDYLGHSTPDKGPLKDDDEWGGDFVDNFVKGIESGDRDLEMAVNQTANILAEANPTNDYSGQLGGINSTLNAIASGRGGMYVINVQLGTQTLGSVVLNQLQLENFRSGGV